MQSRHICKYRQEEKRVNDNVTYSRRYLFMHSPLLRSNTSTFQLDRHSILVLLHRPSFVGAVEHTLVAAEVVDHSSLVVDLHTLVEVVGVAVVGERRVEITSNRQYTFQGCKISSASLT
jgi:hypothetical protein